ncbi:hypothetical protein IL306_010725 [Fusarium sp. DS 682]|nr:hypothetical protein IL306_010725 [Fusarium sp. DS 682]
MPPSTFHPFSRLPVELRLQIWNAACLPSKPYHRGLQYVNVRDDQVMPLSCNWSLALDHQEPQAKTNKSAYLIDGGLWRACKESREVIIKHSHIYDWLRIQRHSFFENGSAAEYYADWLGGEEAVSPSILTIKDGNDEWHLMAYPARDIFCIRTHNWLSIYTDPYGPSVYIPSNVDGDEVWHFIKNVAIEFDQSWSMDFPYSIYDLVKENSARGYLARLLLDRAVDWSTRAPESIWLIDKGAMWSSHPDQDIATVYHDCDGDYIEVDWEHAISKSADGLSPSAKGFIEDFGGQFDGDLDEICRTSRYPDEAYDEYMLDLFDYRPFEISSSVRLLVLRDNEVKLPTWRCKTKCDDIGWCICSEDEGEWWEE